MTRRIAAGPYRLLTAGGPAVYFGWKALMAVENLTDAINSLMPDEQESVRQFVEFLKRKGQSPPSPFLAAVDEFIDQHPELLSRLAQ
jgi:hypothetical protein